ncbi:YtxH domain-containing protein [Nitrospira sp. M1]
MESESRCMLFASMSFLTGLVLGLSSGLLYAPQSGTRTRRKIKHMIDDANDQGEEWVDDTKGSVSDLMKRGKKIVGERNVN